MTWRVLSKFNLQTHAVNVALFLSIPIIGLLDGLGAGRVRLTAFFLIPIMLITWRLGRVPGYLATLAALVILWIVSFVEKPSGTDTLLFALDAAGRFISFFIIVAILSRSRGLYLQQKTIATRDPLTNLYNRLGLQEILGVEMENSRRYGRPFAVLFLDCDNFKKINDQWGHQVGDQLLQAVAQTLIASVRRRDVASRLGGDEFVVFVGDIGEVDVPQLIHKIKANLDTAMRARQWPVTFSIGASIFESTPETVADVIDFADSLMYETKRAGKDGLRSAKWQARWR